jgi:hypothetical protein
MDISTRFNLCRVSYAGMVDPQDPLRYGQWRLECGPTSRVPGAGRLLACSLACLLVYHIFHDFVGREAWRPENKIM